MADATTDWRESSAAAVLGGLIDRMTLAKGPNDYSPPGTPPSSPLDPAPLRSYVFDDGPTTAFDPLGDHHYKAVCDRAHEDPGLRADLQTLYADLAGLPAPVWVRWGRLLAAAETPTWAWAGRLGTLPTPRFGRWPFFLLHQLHCAALDPMPPLRDLEPLWAAGGTHSAEVVGQTFFHGTRRRSFHQTGGTVRQALSRMPDFSPVVAHLHDWLVPHLVSDNHPLFQEQLALLASTDDATLAVYADALTTWSVSGQAKVRGEVTPLVLRGGEAVATVLTERAGSGSASERGRALEMLRRFGGEHVGHARALADADRAASVRRLLEEWDREAELAGAGDVGESGRVDRARLDWSAPVTPEVTEALERIEKRLRYDTVQRPRPPGDPGQLPADHVDRVLRHLPTPDPVPRVMDLLAAPARQRQNVSHGLSPLRGLPAVVALQVAAAYGALRSGEDDSRRLVADLLSSARRDLGPPTLDEAEAMLAALVADGGALLREAMVHGWQKPLADEWPTAEVATWAARHSPALVAQHDEQASEYSYRREWFFQLLALPDRLPEPVVEWLFTKALGAKTTDRAETQELLDDHPEITPRCLRALRHRNAAVRVVAAEWLARRPDPSALQDLETAVRGESQDVARGAILGALSALGRPAEDYLDREQLESQARDAASTALPAALGWFGALSLPAVHWAADGRTVAPETLRWLVVQAVKAKDPVPGAMLGALTSAMVPDDLARWGDALLSGWTDAGAPAGAKGVIALATLGGGRRTTLLAADFVRTFHGKKSVQSKALLGLLARTEDPEALGELVALASDVAAPSIRAEAAVQIDEAAVLRGWTTEELEDRTVPTLGFDGTGVLPLPYGPRVFEAVLAPDLTLALRDQTGATVRTLPAPRKDDDPDRVTAAKALLKAVRRGLATQAKRQTARLRLALECQRSWSTPTFRRDVLDHPLMHRLATRCVWIAEAPEQRLVFRPLDDGSLTDADDGTVTLPDDATIRLAHDSTLTTGERGAWEVHLADYEIAPLLEQTAEPLPPLAEDVLAGTRLRDARGTRTTAGALHGAAGRHGFTRGPVGDAASVDDYRKEIPSFGLTAVLALPTSSYVGDWEAAVELGDLEVTRDLTPLPLSEVPPVLLAELRRALLTLSTMDTRIRSEDR